MTEACLRVRRQWRAQRRAACAARSALIAIACACAAYSERSGGRLSAIGSTSARIARQQLSAPCVAEPSADRGMLAAASTPGSAGSAGRSALPATPVDLHSLPHLPSFSRLARSSSNASVGAGGSPAAAGARGGTTALTPSGGQAQQQHTPLFGSGRTGFSAPRSPGFGSAAAGSGGGIRPRAGSVVAAPGSGAAALDRRLGSSSRRLSAPTGYSESGMSGERH